MKYFTYSDGILNVKCGSDINDVIREAIHLAGESNTLISFEFNGVKFTVLADSDPDLIYRDWDRARKRYIDPVVGPSPRPVLTDEEKVSDAHISSVRGKRVQEQKALKELKANLT